MKRIYAGAFGLLVSSFLSTAKADPMPMPLPPGPPTSAFNVASPQQLDARFLGEFRAPHEALIKPQRARGKALLGTGIAVGGIGFITIIAGGASAGMAGLDKGLPEYDAGAYHRGLYALGGGVGVLLIGVALTTLGGLSTKEASEHDRAIADAAGVTYAR